MLFYLIVLVHADTGSFLTFARWILEDESEPKTRYEKQYVSVIKSYSVDSIC